MLSNLLGGDLVKNVGGIIDSLHTSQEEKDNAKIKLKQLENDLQTKQMEINKVEAGHKSIFVAGWRPCIGWVCALGLFYNRILSNILAIWVEVPEIDTTLLVPVMMGMLGLGAMRSYEKVQGVSREK